MTGDLAWIRDSNGDCGRTPAYPLALDALTRALTAIWLGRSGPRIQKELRTTMNRALPAQDS